MSYHFKKKRKYKNTKVEKDGHKFDSKKEAARYLELALLERAGVISDLELQPVYKISTGKATDPFTGRKMAARKYTADFRYRENGKTIVEEIKSPGTAGETAYRLRRQLFVEQYGREVVFREIR